MVDPKNPFAGKSDLPINPPPDIQGAGIDSELLNDVFNLADVPDVSFDPIPVGTYPAIVSEADYGISKSASRRRQVTLVFTVTNEGQARKLWYYGGLDEKSQPYTVKAIRAIAPDLDLRSFRPATDIAKLVNRKCKIKVGIQNGTDQDGSPRVQNVIKEVMADEASAFLNR